MSLLSMLFGNKPKNRRGGQASATDHRHERDASAVISPATSCSAN